MPAPPIHFRATIVAIGSWLIVRLPADASAQLPSRGQVMVTGSIGGNRFRAALEPDGMGGHWLNAGAHIPASTQLAAGDTALMEIEPTKDWPEPDVPADWKAALAADSQLRTMWIRVTPMARWEWLRWIGSTKQPETRRRRVEASISKLKAGERRPCCFNRNMCCIPDVSKNGVLLQA